MTKHVITLDKKDSLEKAEYLFKRNAIQHIPILDKNSVIGILSYSDVKRFIFANSAEDSDTIVCENFTVEEIMTRNVFTVNVHQSVKDVAELLVQKEFHTVPVLDNNLLVGIVTSTDLIKYLLKNI